MIVLDLTPVEAAHLAHALRRHLHLVGTDRVPERLAAIGRQLDAVHRQPDAAHDTSTDHELMSYTTTAEILGTSTRTLSRLVADGTLERVGRRITRDSVERLIR